jgi:hypothetical protein
VILTNNIVKVIGSIRIAPPLFVVLKIREVKLRRKKTTFYKKLLSGSSNISIIIKLI